MRHFNGITRFELGWRKLPLTEVTWEDIADYTETFMFSNLDREDGDVIELTLIGYDVTDYAKVGICFRDSLSFPTNMSFDKEFIMGMFTFKSKNYIFFSKIL